MSLKSLMRIAEQYLRKHPIPKSTQIQNGMLKLIYNYQTPFTNSKQNKQIYYPFNDIKQGSILKSYLPKLNFDEKGNKLQFINQFDSILVQESHQKVLQDDYFGIAQLNVNRDKWVYVAKKKIPKSKSYFLGGVGKSEFVHDLGQGFWDISQIGIYIWDLKLKKIIPIDVKIQNDDSKYLFCCPKFANDQGTKFICRGRKRTQFRNGFNIQHNQPVDIFEVAVENIGLENMKITCKRLVKKQKTNIFISISPCYNYIMYYGGTDITHTYYMDLIILKRRSPQDTNSNNEQGYDNQWIQLHRIKEEYVGFQNHSKGQSFVYQNQPYTYYHLIQNSQLKIKCINMATGSVIPVTDNKIGQFYQMLNYVKEQQLITGVVRKHDSKSFFYIKTSDHKVNIIPPLNRQDFKIEVVKDPIHGFLLDTDHVDQQFKKEKKPLLVIIHGGPHAHCEPSIDLLKYMLLKCGYMILYPCYSGTIGFGQKFLKGALQKIGDVDAKQIIEQIQNVCKIKQKIDRSRVHVHGFSYGGFLAWIMGTRYSEYFKSAVVVNGVVSIVGNFWATDIPEWTATQVLNRLEFHNFTMEDYKKMHELQINTPMKIPTLQLLGGKDRRVPFRQGLLFDAITKKHGTKIETYLYEEEGHRLGDQLETSVDCVMKVVQFLEEMKVSKNTEEKTK